MRYMSALGGLLLAGAPCASCRNMCLSNCGPEPVRFSDAPAGLGALIAVVRRLAINASSRFECYIKHHQIPNL
jgi:hypothetical protein